MPKEPKFKPGDKVRIISQDAPTKEHFRKEFRDSTIYEEPFVPNQNDILTISKVCEPIEGRSQTYKMKEDNGFFIWDEAWLTPYFTELSIFLKNISESDNGGNGNE